MTLSQIPFLIKIIEKVTNLQFWTWFLGGLSLHLNHIRIASHMGICYRQFGTLPIGIFLSNLDSKQLDTSLVTSYGHFCHMSILATPGPFEYFCQHMGPSENQSFLNEGAISGR